MNFNKIIRKTINLNTFAFFASLVVLWIIATTLHQGISCDEGFYLMGYQSDQALGDLISDYANIVRAITPQALEENIMVYRCERLIGFLMVLSLFGVSLYRWLKKKYAFEMSKLLFASLVFLSGALTYIFASPTISYDSIQTFVYLLSFSFLFLSITSTRLFWKNVFLTLTGLFSIVGILNYFPSGVFLLAVLSIFILIEFQEKKLKNLLVYSLGIIIGLIVYHFLIRNMVEYAGIAYQTIVTALTEKSPSRHDSGGLIKSFLIKFGIFLTFIPVTYLLSLIIRKIKIPTILYYVFLGATALFLLVYRQFYAVYAPVFFIPMVFLLAGLLAENRRVTCKTIFNKEGFIVTLLIVLPFLGVFGTNQNLFAKMLIFMPFWLIVFLILRLKLMNARVVQSATLLMIVIMFAGYVYLGNFSRFHYYYTPRSSKFPLENMEREQKITVSKFQQAYYHEVADSLRHYGAQKGDEYLAFGENQMTVFLMGGYVSGKLPYHWFQYKKFPEKAPKFFVLFKNEEQEVIELLKDTGWKFPENYHRMEMRAMSENMNQEELKTVIYMREKGVN